MMRLFTEGNVGIGTDSPRTTLDINGAMAYTSIKTLVVETENFTGDVSNHNLFRYDPGSDVSITGFTGGKTGQEIILLINQEPGSQVELVHDDAKMKLDGSVNTPTPSCGDNVMTIKLMFDGSVWWETNRSYVYLDIC